MSLFGHIISGLVETVVDRALTTVADSIARLVAPEPVLETASKGVSSLKAGRSITAEPSLGRFLVRDPIRYDGGTNLYAYCGNNPVNAVDPWGLQEFDPDEYDRGKLLNQSFMGTFSVENAKRMGWSLLEALNLVDPEGAAVNAAIEAATDPSGTSGPNLTPVGSPKNATRKAAKKALKSLAEDHWELGAFKSAEKWKNQMTKRGWTAEQITEALRDGKSYVTANKVNKGNSATRFVHPVTGRSVIIDDVTREILQVGGDGFLY